MKQHRRHFDSGRRTTRGKRAYALCARDLYWQPDTPECQKRLTADPLLVTCRACHAKSEYRAALLVLEPAVLAQVAVLLDWILDHPGEPLRVSPLSTILASLVTRGFPLDLAVQEPQRVLGYLQAAPTTNAAHGGTAGCAAFIAQVERERADRERERAHALAVGRVERARLEVAAERQQAEQRQHQLRVQMARLAAEDLALQGRLARQAALSKHEDLRLALLCSVIIAGVIYFLVRAYL